MASTPILATFGWLVAPLFKSIRDKVYNHLSTYILNKVCDHRNTSTDTGIEKRRKLLQAEIPPILPHLSLAIDKAEKSPKKQKLMDWLERLKVAYYEAEEAIDLLDYEQLEQKVMDGRKLLEQPEKNERRVQISLTPQFVSRPLKNASLKSKYGVKLKSCIDKLKKLEEEADEFRDLLESNENDRDTFSEPPSRVFGREKDKENIVGLLTKEPFNSEPGPTTRPAIPIIAITGRSGVGKTALAQYVYKHMDGHDHFDIHVWVHVPRKFKATDVIKIMIENIEGKTDTPTTDEALLKHTRGMVGSKKLLLVLDDFWSDTMDFHEQWEKFFKLLSSCSPGSKILLTTQSKNTTQQAGLAGVTDVETYNLEEIEEDQFLELFMHYAWPSNSHLQKEEFEKIGQNIAIKLKGDPGVAKLVAHQLSGKLDLRHWEEVAEKDWLRDNMKARIWSYQQLPPDIQRCFALCSLFPKGVTFRRQYLIDLWMAVGLIRPIDKHQRLEDIGQNYLHELVSRFFLEQDEDKNGIHLHDLLHDLAERVQGDDFIRIESTYPREAPPHLNIRHIYLPSSMINKLKEKLCLMKNMCTFRVEPDGAFVPKEVLEEILKNMEKLRVLELPECGDDELPDSIGNLKHLRLVHSYRFASLKKLPDSICKLYHLQKLVLPNCKSLPKDFSDLINLRRIRTFGETMSHISHVGRLTSIQNLDQFIVRKERGNELHQLQNLNQLRKMEITGLENVGSIEDAVNANMGNKKYLEELNLEWKSDERDTHNIRGPSTQHVELLDALQPHPDIGGLTIIGFGGDRFPNWLLSQNSLRNLRSLILMDCNEVEEISSIHESLPRCTRLILQGFKNLKKMPTFPPNLNSLKISNIPQLSYFSEDDFLKKEERNQSNHQVVKQIVECLKSEDVRLPIFFKSNVKHLFLFAKHRLEAVFVDSSDLLLDEWAEILTFDPWNKDYSRDQLLDAWVMFMHCHMETMLYKNEEYSKLFLPYSLTYLKISSCSITDDALSTCIQCLVSLSELELSSIQTITSLPSKEVLCLLKNLHSLIIEGCYLLSSLGGIGALSSLIALELDGCINLNTSNEPLPSSLKRLKFRNCSNVDVIIAESILPVLFSLDVQDIMFKNQRRVLHVSHLPSLKDLTIIGLDGRLEGLNSLTALCSLRVWEIRDINPSSLMAKLCASALRTVSVDNPLQLKLILSNETISSINSLNISLLKGDSSDYEVVESLASLNCLSFHSCTITHLPTYLKNLASLHYMYLNNCPNLCELEELPRNLCELRITGCPTLTEKFNKGGPYRVRFDGISTIVTFPTKEERNRF